MARAKAQPCFFGGMYGAYADRLIEAIRTKYNLELTYRELPTMAGYGDLVSTKDISIGVERYATIRAFIDGYKLGIGA